MALDRFPSRNMTRALARRWMSNLLASLYTIVIIQRAKTAGRFGKPSDGTRLVVLGIGLTVFAALELFNVITKGLIGTTSGAAAIFGGILLDTIIIRISSTKLYIDWLLTGVVYIWLGMLVTGNTTLSLEMTFVLFCLLLFTSALLKIWTGIIDGRHGMTWLVADGVMSVIFVLSAIAMRLLPVAAGVNFILVCDLMIYGVSIVGFGLSLNGARD